jgi:crotonobetainyl-CoA:carnitine CoA-transferase CaiB-like acyl-CoA transferase
MRLDLPSALAKTGTIPGVRTPIMVDGKPMAAERPAPRLGEHTDEILGELGLPGEEIGRLRAAGVV